MRCPAVLFDNGLAGAAPVTRARSLLLRFQMQECDRRERRGGRVVDGSGLENRQSASSRGFESHPLRQSIADGGSRIAYSKEQPKDDKRGGDSDQNPGDDV